MTFRLGKIPLRVHPLLPICWAFSFLWGGGVLPALAALGLHECGHLLAAKLLRVPVDEVEITPYGGVIAVRGLEAMSLCPALLLAAAGPLFSLLGCIISPWLLQSGIISFSWAQTFARANALLLFINLLPVLPLDGGRMLRVLLSRLFPHAAVTRALTAAGYALGALLCGVTVFFALRGDLLLAPLFAGLYLIYAAALEGRQGTARYVTALIARRQKLEGRIALPVEHLAVRGDAPAAAVLTRLHPGRFHVLYILSPDGMTALGTMDERALCDAVLSQGGEALQDCIKTAARKPP